MVTFLILDCHGNQSVGDNGNLWPDWLNKDIGNCRSIYIKYKKHTKRER